LTDPVKFQEVYYKGYHDGKWHHRIEGFMTGIALSAFAILAFKEIKSSHLSPMELTQAPLTYEEQ